MGSLSQVEVTSIEKWSIEDQVFIDVRSPGEFQQGHLPNAINAPILDDAERALIGLTYKQKGNAEAVRLGHELVSGANKLAKINLWKAILQKNPNAILTCFRGGQRSQITQSWLKLEGFDRPLIKGGYKSSRQALIDKINKASSEYQFLLISGPTGAGKTLFLNELKMHWPTINLEGYAEHRGSAFGGMGTTQPAQAVFENRLAWDILKVDKTILENNLPLVMEDESRLIGRCVIPDQFFFKLRESPIIWLDTSLDERIENTFDEYILKANVSEELFARYKKALSNIQKRLGGLRYQEISKILEKCEAIWKSRGELEENKEWIKLLLVHYYDPLYFGSLEKRQPSILFKGPAEEALDFLKGQKSKHKEKAVKAKANPT